MKRGLAHLALAIVACAALTACDNYEQSSPQAVIDSAKQMVSDGRADQLYTLIYTESDREKRVWRQVGSLLGSLQELAVEVNKAYPDEVAKLRTQAEEAAADGRASSIIAGLFTGQATGEQQQGPSQEMLTQLFGEIMSDPFGWLSESEDRLGEEWVSEDLRALTWDGKMVLPPLGVLLKLDDGKWYVMMPTNLPAAQRFLPDNDEFWEALPELVHVFDNTVDDLTADVRGGKVRDLASLSEQAGKKAFIPMMIAAYAIGKAAEMDESPPEESSAQEDPGDDPPAQPDEQPDEGGGP